MDEDIKDYLGRIKQQSFFGDASTAGSLKSNIRWYQNCARTSHHWFRVVGFTTVFLSVSLPFMAAIYPNEVQPTVIMSWLIALAGGANGFFQWGRAWQSRTEAYIRLERLMMQWEVAVHDPNAEISAIITATNKLVTDARETIKNETGTFFEEVQFPEVESSKSSHQ
ncbi:SLATT domain-containing protein [Shewanella waksmanii]|uniref:SLATT domain-containing protein n=1 Tax=Shewanella waksmanii TaxID=213783 RepID=UPI0037355C86